MNVHLSSRRIHVVTAITFAVCLSAINNGPLFWNREAPGDLGDSRFNIFVLEHVYRWLTGASSSLGSPAIFYPFPDALFFSDTHAGSALVYALFRALGQSEYLAYDTWFLVGCLATFAAAYYAIARFGGGPLMSGLGAAIFAFSLPSIAQIGHAQLVYRCGVPLALLYLWLGIRDGSARNLVVAFIWLCVQMLLSVYIGMFLLLMMVAFAIAAPLAEQGLPRPKEWLRSVWNEPRRIFGSDRLNRNKSVLVVLVAAIVAAATVAMFARYAHVTHEYLFTRAWSEVATMLPRPVSYLLMPELPYWSPVSTVLAQSAPMAHEHHLFVGFGAMGLMVVGLLAVLRNAKPVVGAMPAKAMALTLLLVLLVVTVANDSFTLYRPLAVLPGFSAIRAVTRIGLVLAFPVAVLAAIGLRSLVVESKPKILGSVIAGLLCCLAGYEFVTIERLTFSIANAEQRVDAIVAAARERAQGIQSPILLVVNPKDDGDHVQLDAMLAAQRLGWATVNGYSGNLPPGAAPVPTCALASRQFAVYRLWRAQRRFKDQIEDTGSLMNRVVFVGADCDSELSNRVAGPAPRHSEQPSETLPRDVTLLPAAFDQKGSVVTFKVTIKNNSADQWIPGLSPYPLSISWRFAPTADTGNGDDVAWDTREALPTDVAPGGAVTMTAVAAAPAQPGNYRLEISLVADGLFWFHNKGMRPLQFEQIVTVP